MTDEQDRLNQLDRGIQQTATADDDKYRQEQVHEPDSLRWFLCIDRCVDRHTVLSHEASWGCISRANDMSQLYARSPLAHDKRDSIMGFSGSVNQGQFIAAGQRCPA